MLQVVSFIAIITIFAACHIQMQIEEAHLQASFGGATRDFASLVPRWIGVAR